MYTNDDLPHQLKTSTELFKIIIFPYEMGAIIVLSKAARKKTPLPMMGNGVDIL